MHHYGIWLANYIAAVNHLTKANIHFIKNEAYVLFRVFFPK